MSQNSIAIGGVGLPPSGGSSGEVGVLAFGTVRADGVTDDAAALQAIVNAHPGATIYLPTTVGPLGGTIRASYRLASVPPGNPPGVALYLKDVGTTLRGDGIGTLVSVGPRLTGIWAAGGANTVSDLAVHGPSAWGGSNLENPAHGVIPVGQAPGLTVAHGGDDSDGIRVTGLNCVFRNLNIQWFGRDGINASAQDQNLAADGACEDCTFDTIYIYGCRRHGVRIQGGDSNVNTWNAVSVNACGGWGYDIESFLGQTVTAGQTNNNGFDLAPYGPTDTPRALVSLSRAAGGVVTAVFLDAPGIAAGDGVEIRSCHDASFLGRWPAATVSPDGKTVTWNQVGAAAATLTLRAPVVTIGAIGGVRVPVGTTAGVSAGMFVIGGGYAYGPMATEVTVTAVDAPNSEVLLSDYGHTGGAFSVTFCDAIAYRNMLPTTAAVLSATRAPVAASVAFGGTVTLGSAVITGIASTAGILPGAAVTGTVPTNAGTAPPFPLATSVVSVDSPTQITVDQACISVGNNSGGATLTAAAPYYVDAGSCLVTLTFQGAYATLYFGVPYPLVAGLGVTLSNAADPTFNGTFICLTVGTDGSGNTRVTYAQQGVAAGGRTATLTAGAARMAFPSEAWRAAGMTGGGYYTSGYDHPATSPNTFVGCYAEGGQPSHLGQSDVVISPVGADPIAGGATALSGALGGLNLPGTSHALSLRTYQDGDEIKINRVGLTATARLLEKFQDVTRGKDDPKATLWETITGPTQHEVYAGDSVYAATRLFALRTDQPARLASAPGWNLGLNSEAGTGPAVLIGDGTGGANYTLIAGGSVQPQPLADAAAPRGGYFVGADHPNGGGSPSPCYKDSAGAVTVLGTGGGGATAAGVAGQVQVAGAAGAFAAAAGVTAPGGAAGSALTFRVRAQAAGDTPLAVQDHTGATVLSVDETGALVAHANFAPASGRLGSAPDDPGTAGVWLGQATPSASNATLAASGGLAILGGSAGARVTVGGFWPVFFDPNAGAPRTIFGTTPDAAAGDTAASVSVVCPTSAWKGLAVRTRTGQTAHPLEVQAPDGTPIGYFNPDGSLTTPALAGAVRIDAHYGAVATAADGATVTFDLSVSDRWTVTLGGNRTLTISNMQPGQVAQLELVEGGAGGWTPVWTQTIRWAGGTAPGLATAAGKADLVTIYKRYDGTYAGGVALAGY